MEELAPNLLEVLSNNIAAVFGLLGVAVGVILSHFSNISLRTHDLKLRLREKVLDKRIVAHEKVITLAKSLRTMVNIGVVLEDDELARAPYFLITHEAFNEYQATFTSVFGESSTWLDIELTKELNLLQDYSVNLDQIVRQASPELLPVIGNVVRQDFVDFSSEIEKKAYTFFEKDLENLQLGRLSEWHKYSREESERRLRFTQLFIRREEINRIIER